MLLACAVLFVVIAKLDATAAQDVKDRARAAQVDRAPARAARSGPTATGVAVAGGGVVESPQRKAHAGSAGAGRGFTPLFLLAAVGAVLAAAGAALLRFARR